MKRAAFTVLILLVACPSLALANGALPEGGAPMGRPVIPALTAPGSSPLHGVLSAPYGAETLVGARYLEGLLEER